IRVTQLTVLGKMAGVTKIVHLFPPKKKIMYHVRVLMQNACSYHPVEDSYLLWKARFGTYLESIFLLQKLTLLLCSNLTHIYYAWGQFDPGNLNPKNYYNIFFYPSLCVRYFRFVC